MRMLITYLFTFCAIGLMAQGKQSKQEYLKMNLGYGMENNWGNTSFVFGAGYEISYSKKFSLSGDVDYFTTGIYNTYLAHPTSDIPNEERYYNAVFLSARTSYSLVGNRNKFNVSLSAGPTVFYRSYKVMVAYAYRQYLNGRIEVIPGSVKYEAKKGVRLGYYTGIDFNLPVKNRFVFSLGLDSYSNLIPLEFLIGSITFKKRLTPKGR